MNIIPAADLIDRAMQERKKQDRLEPYRDAVRHAETWRERLSAIRALYQHCVHVPGGLKSIDPYDLGMESYWSPIEAALWADICHLMPDAFYPQYPVGRYFVDFGCPDRKIAIEADGRQFHDLERDRARDSELFRRHGWKVFRVTGSEALRVRPSPAAFASECASNGTPSNADEMRDVAIGYFMNTSLGVVHAIRDLLIEPVDDAYNSIKRLSLMDHRLADFEVRG